MPRHKAAVAEPIPEFKASVLRPTTAKSAAATMVNTKRTQAVKTAARKLSTVWSSMCLSMSTA